MADERLLRELDGKYRILAQLGEGGTAHVWLAVAQGPSGFNKLVVLKTIRSELLEEPAVVDMFLDEARLAARLNHPNVVQTNEVFHQAKHPIIVMEYLDGVPFSAVLERQRSGNAMALAMLLRVISEALAGLHSAHELADYDGTNFELVHRDVSPHNLFITFAGQVKVLDFGVAQLTTSQEITQTGELKGKLRYMAPEQVASERVDRRADIYSVGVILWEIAAARRMWTPGTPEVQIMRNTLSGELPSLSDLETPVDKELQELIEKALATRPADRFETALELQAALDKYISSLRGLIRDRDVGRTLSKMFAHIREERAATIEEQMKNPAPPKRDATYSTHVPELTSFTHTPGEPARPARRPTSPWVLLVAIFFSISAFVAALFWPEPSQGNTESPIAAASAVAAPPPSASSSPGESPVEPSTQAPKEKSITLHLTAFPRTARLTLDGEKLPGNPYSSTAASDESDHVVEVSAPGYIPQSKTVQFNKDLSLAITLLPKKRPISKSDAPNPSPAKAKVDVCAPPYFFDERGIKKYKPECM